MSRCGSENPSAGSARVDADVPAVLREVADLATARILVRRSPRPAPEGLATTSAARRAAAESRAVARARRAPRRHRASRRGWWRSACPRPRRRRASRRCRAVRRARGSSCAAAADSAGWRRSPARCAATATRPLSAVAVELFEGGALLRPGRVGAGTDDRGGRHRAAAGQQHQRSATAPSAARATAQAAGS